MGEGWREGEMVGGRGRDVCVLEPECACYPPGQNTSIPIGYTEVVSECYKWSVVCLFVGCLTSQQQASVSQGRICSDNFTCYHTEAEAADPTFYLTQSQYTDTGPTSPSADPITQGARQGSHWSANV